MLQAPGPGTPRRWLDRSPAADDTEVLVPSPACAIAGYNRYAHLYVAQVSFEAVDMTTRDPVVVAARDPDYESNSCEARMKVSANSWHSTFSRRGGGWVFRTNTSYGDLADAQNGVSC